MLPLEILAVSFGMLLPLTIAIGILVTFRIAGPLYRFERFLELVIRGEQVGPCKLRNGDELQDLCDLINEATRPLRMRTANGDGPHVDFDDDPGGDVAEPQGDRQLAG